MSQSEGYGLHPCRMSLLAGSVQTADMYCDDPGVWFFHCHINDHIAAGMKTFYTVSSNGLIQAGAGGVLLSPMHRPPPAASMHGLTKTTALLLSSTCCGEGQNINSALWWLQCAASAVATQLLGNSRGTASLLGRCTGASVYM